MIRPDLRPILFFLLAAAAIPAQIAGVTGDWQEPGGSIIRIAPCGQELCARLVRLSPQAPTPFDIHNPDPAKRHDRLCGLRIGYGFHQDSPMHAGNGRLYDPKTGKTYQGEMTAAGKVLHLRGFVGIRLFGRTEDWVRVTAPAPGCA